MSARPDEPLPMVQRDTLESQVHRALRAAILKGRFEGGHRLVQEELAQEFGTSRIPVRDAIKRLAAEGLVDVDHHGSHRVRAFGPDDAVEVYRIRGLLEPFAARLALAAVTPRQVDEFERLTHEMAAAANESDFERYTELNAAWHMKLNELSGLPRLTRIIETLWHGRPALTPLEIPGQLERSIAEHHEMHDAICARDGQRLESALRDHIRNALDAVLVQHARRR